MPIPNSPSEERGGKIIVGNANKELVINNTPHTPRKRGAEIASLENYTLALKLWRETCAEAGLAFIVDNCTANGARKVAARYLDTEILTPEAVKRAMQKLAHQITHNEKAQHYTLNALGNNVSRYVDAPKRETASITPKHILWDFTCSYCGKTSAGYYPATVEPNPMPCTERGCQGLMIPKKG